MSKRAIGIGITGIVLVAATAHAQLAGRVASTGCGALVTNNQAELGELYVMKTLNPGGGPDGHQDWLFDLRAKGGWATQNTTAGGPIWDVPNDFHHNTVPPEEVFMLLTYPDGYLAIDSASMRGNPENLGIVQRQRVGNSLPLGIENGAGLVLPGNATPYTAGLRDRSGSLALYPFGTAWGINVAFAPIAEINPAPIGATGCTIGGDVEDQNAGFGIITGYNVYRLAGVPSVVPTPADFIGAWEYYIPYDSFDLAVPDTLGTAGPDVNGDTLPDGDGTPAPSDSVPNDLAGLQNPNGIPHDGDEVIIYQDSHRLPDGSPRDWGTGPDTSGTTGYWYAFQPVLFPGPSTLADWNGIGFSSSDQYFGDHAMDTDADGIYDALDLDMDGSMDFYSPQAVMGHHGMGLTNGGVPLLSPPVFGRANPLPALLDPRLEASVEGRNVQIRVFTGFETADVVAYDVRRAGSARGLVNRRSIAAQGGEGNVYTLTDTLPSGARRSRVQLAYEVDVRTADGDTITFGPFAVEAPATVARRTR